MTLQYLPAPCSHNSFKFVRATLTVELAPANQAPDCAGASPSVGAIWPPNGKFVEVMVEGVGDPEGDAVAIEVTGVAQDEPVDKKKPNATGVRTSTAQLRAERDGGGGTGRVYHVAFEATDGQGGACTGEVTVAVPHDHGGGAVDDGPLHDSTQGQGPRRRPPRGGPPVDPFPASNGDDRTTKLLETYPSVARSFGRALRVWLCPGRGEAGALFGL